MADAKQVKMIEIREDTYNNLLLSKRAAGQFCTAFVMILISGIVIWMEAYVFTGESSVTIRLLLGAVLSITLFCIFRALNTYMQAGKGDI